jgi:hypothetical protein
MHGILINIIKIKQRSFAATAIHQKLLAQHRLIL